MPRQNKHSGDRAPWVLPGKIPITRSCPAAVIAAGFFCFMNDRCYDGGILRKFFRIVDFAVQNEKKKLDQFIRTEGGTPEKRMKQGRKRPADRCFSQGRGNDLIRSIDKLQRIIII